MEVRELDCLKYGPAVSGEDFWAQLQLAQPVPVDSGRSSFHMSLQEGEHLDDPMLLQLFAECTLIRPGIDLPSPIQLCGGDADCPTTQEQVADGVEHNCAGILGQKEFRGQEVWWVGCGWLGKADGSAPDPALLAPEHEPMMPVRRVVELPEFLKTEDWEDVYTYGNRDWLTRFSNDPTALPDSKCTELFKAYCWAYWDAYREECGEGSSATHSWELFAKLPFVGDRFKGITQVMVADDSVMRAIFDSFLQAYHEYLRQVQFYRMQSPGYDRTEGHQWISEMEKDADVFEQQVRRQIAKGKTNQIAGDVAANVPDMYEDVAHTNRENIMAFAKSSTYKAGVIMKYVMAGNIVLVGSHGQATFEHHGKVWEKISTSSDLHSGNIRITYRNMLMGHKGKIEVESVPPALQASVEFALRKCPLPVQFVDSLTHGSKASGDSAGAKPTAGGERQAADTPKHDVIAGLAETCRAHATSDAGRLALAKLLAGPDLFPRAIKVTEVQGMMDECCLATETWKDFQAKHGWGKRTDTALRAVFTDAGAKKGYVLLATYPNALTRDELKRLARELLHK